jgi:hypothetical protein
MDRFGERVSPKRIRRGPGVSTLQFRWSLLDFCRLERRVGVIIGERWSPSSPKSLLGDSFSLISVTGVISLDADSPPLVVLRFVRGAMAFLVCKQLI